MKTTHTPGPWWIVRSSDYTKDLEDTKILSIESPNNTTILFTDSGYFKPLEADARLIAAAPDMLAALQVALATIERLDARAKARSAMGTVDVLRAAIAQATGETT